MKTGIVVIVVLLNCLLFSGCGTTTEIARYGAAYEQGAQGRTYIGSASSQSECYELAKQRGCSDSYVWMSKTNDCYCK